MRVGHVQFCGSELSYQFLLQVIFFLHEYEMYDCSRHAYRDRVKVVSFQVVPDQCCRQCVMLRVLSHKPG